MIFMQRVLLSVVIALLMSCTSADISGPYASRASAEDIREITRLVRSHPKGVLAEVWAPLARITFESADRAKVELEDSRILTSFIVRNRGGQWSIDKSTIKSIPLVIVTA